MRKIFKMIKIKLRETANQKIFILYGGIFPFDIPHKKAVQKNSKSRTAFFACNSLENKTL